LLVLQPWTYDALLVIGHAGAHRTSRGAATGARIAIDAVVFDRDGVLTYFDLAGAARYLAPLVPLSVGAVVARWQICQNAHAAPRSEDDERALWELFWTGLADELGLDADRRRRLLAFDYTRTVRAYPDARPALLALRALGVRRAVFSNFSLPSIGASLAACGLGDLVEAAWTGGVVGVRKPSRASYEFVLDALAVPPDRGLLLDDTPANVAGARALGMQAWLVDRSGRSAAADRSLRDLSTVAERVAGGMEPDVVG